MFCNNFCLGFIEGIKTADAKLSEFTLYQLSSETAAALGAACLGARHIAFQLPVDYTANSSVLFHYVSSDYQ